METHRTPPNTRPTTTAGRRAMGRYFRFVRRCVGLWRFALSRQLTEVCLNREQQIGELHHDARSVFSSRRIP
jgi:hypothetical protein